MTNYTKKIFITLFFFLLVLFGLLYSSSYAIIGGTSLKEVENTSTQGSSAETVIIEKPALQYTSDSLRDPFKPYIVEQSKDGSTEIAQEPPPNLTIQGIIWGGSTPQAIINNSVLKIGDVIEDARIIDITKEGVTVFFKNRQFKLGSPSTSGAPQTTQ